MPKIKPTTLFSKRTLPIVLVNGPGDCLLKASMLAQPIIDELTKQLPRKTPDVIHVNDTGDDILNKLTCIDALCKITKPTVLVFPNVLEKEDVFSCYLKFLIASGGGFVVRIRKNAEEHDLNGALPIFNLDPDKNSFIDIEYKVGVQIGNMLSAENINHHITIQSVANNAFLHNKLGICLGAWIRSEETEGKELSMIVNVSGIAGNPITIEEFATKVWNNPEVDRVLLNPANALVVRNPSIESKLVLAKVLSANVDAKKIKLIEV